MLQFLLTWLATAISLLITAWIVPGIVIASFTAAAIGAIVLGLINAIVKPILILFTLPLTILTLGLFLLVINAIALALVGYFTPGFDVAGFFPALFGSIVLSLVSGVINQFFQTSNL
ncbi:phage holin family protein [Pleurocapsales cyanobacterium LEGE 06147]|nr:phage holin family protein [Pleurocapsales cyanobacterium LEGE 06147]